MSPKRATVLRRALSSASANSRQPRSPFCARRGVADAVRAARQTPRLARARALHETQVSHEQLRPSAPRRARCWTRAAAPRLIGRRRFAVAAAWDRADGRSRSRTRLRRGARWRRYVHRRRRAPARRPADVAEQSSSRRRPRAHPSGNTLLCEERPIFRSSSTRQTRRSPARASKMSSRAPQQWTCATCASWPRLQPVNSAQ